MLLESNLIDEIQMEIALEEQQRSKKRFGSTLVDLNFIDENVLAAFLSKQMDIPCINIMHIVVPKKLRDLIPIEVAKHCEAVPIKLENDRLYVAMVDPTDITLITELEEITGISVSPFVAPQTSILKKIEELYHDHHASAGRDNPIFSDVINQVEGGFDLEKRLAGIEYQLKEIKKLMVDILAYESNADDES